VKCALLKYVYILHIKYFALLSYFWELTKSQTIWIFFFGAKVISYKFITNYVVYMDT